MRPEMDNPSMRIAQLMAQFMGDNQQQGLSNPPAGPMQDVRDGEPLYSNNPGVQRKKMQRAQWEEEDNQRGPSPDFLTMLTNFMAGR